MQIKNANKKGLNMNEISSKKHIKMMVKRKNPGQNLGYDNNVKNNILV